jgi:hypothetical protein
MTWGRASEPVGAIQPGIGVGDAREEPGTVPG